MRIRVAANLKRTFVTFHNRNGIGQEIEHAGKRDFSICRTCLKRQTDHRDDLLVEIAQKLHIRGGCRAERINGIGHGKGKRLDHCRIQIRLAI